jgi:hypothetical protein
MQGWNEREKKIIELSKAGKTIREIAAETHTSFRDIGQILRRSRGGYEPNEETAPYLNAAGQPKSQSSMAYEMYRQGKKPLEVAIALGVSADDAERWFSEYARLSGLDDLCKVCEQTRAGDSLADFLLLYKLMEGKSLSPHEFVNDLESRRQGRQMSNELEELESHLGLAKLDMDDAKNQLQEKNKKLSEVTKKLEQAETTLKEKERRIQHLERQCQTLELRKSSLDKLIQNTDTTGLKKTIEKIVQREASSLISSNQEHWEIAIIAIAEFLQDQPQLLESLLLAITAGNPGARDRFAVWIAANYGAIVEKYQSRLAMRVGLLSSVRSHTPTK